MILTRASLICDISTFVITLKTACSYGKSMHYIPPVTISSANWLHGDPKDDHGFKLLTQLPVRKSICYIISANLYIKKEMVKKPQGSLSFYAST